MMARVEGPVLLKPFTMQRMAAFLPKPRSCRALYEELYSALCDAIREGDIHALNGFLYSDVLVQIAPEDILPLWDLCWTSWQLGPPRNPITLGAFMAAIKGLHPSLPVPAWIGEIDPEAAE